MSVFNRREFLERGAILGAVATAGLGFDPQSAQAADEAAKSRKGGANDRLRVAVVGVRGRGMSHVSGFLGKNNCEIVTVCDCDEAVISKAMEAIKSKQGALPKFEKDKNATRGS